MTTNLLARLSGITQLTKTELRDLRRAGNAKKRVQLCEPETNSLHSREELAHAWKVLEKRKAQQERIKRG